MIRAADIPPQAWRNGGGQTRELLVWPSIHEWNVRISVATIDMDGPFSTYPGVERWFAVVAGAGVDLAIDGATHRMDPSSPPLRFDGGADINCHLLDGPTRDLNLMARRGSGVMQSAVSSATWHPGATQCGLFVTVPGHCIALDHDELEIAGESLVWFDSPPRTLTFRARAIRATRPIGWWLAYRQAD